MNMVPSPSTPLVFTFPATAEPVRSLMIDGEPWFVIADACKILALSNPTMAAERIDDDDLSTAEVIDSMGRTQQPRITNEPGLYDLIFQSRKPQAKAFKRWVTHEVIPAIRQTGRYEAAPAQLTNRDLARMVIEEADRADIAERQVAELAPAANSWNVLASGDGDFSVADAAKILSRDPQISIGRNRLFTLLAEWRWTYRQQIDGRARAMQTAIETGRLSELPSSHYHPRTGELVLDAPQVRVTAKGLAEAHKRLGGTAPVQVPSVPAQGGAL